MMSNNSTAISSPAEATDLVSFQILFNNKEINGEYRITALETAHYFNKISYAKISILDGDVAKQDFTISSKDDSLVPGNEMEIRLGYHGKTKTIFKGIISKHAIRSNKSKSSFLLIEGKDKCTKLATGRKNKAYIDKTDSEIFEQMAKDAGFKSSEMEIDSTSVRHTEMIQYNAADWDFIVSRAEMNSLLVLTDNNKLVIKKPDTTLEPVKEIVYGKEVIEFDSELYGQSQIDEVRSHSWSYKDQELSGSNAAVTVFGESGNINGKTLAASFGVNEFNQVHTGNLQAGELQSWSNARLLKSRLSKITGKIRLKGLTGIKPGNMVTLKGFGKRFNGNVFVTGIRHVYDKSAWETEIIFGISEKWFYEQADIMEKPASGLVPGINGLQIGIVIKIDGDPDNENRVQIQLPALQTKEGLWARVAALDAGNNRGTFFMPEVDDEVVVGFLNSDPRHAIILGMLHSSAKPAPFTSKEANNEKGFVTRSGIKFIFDDDKKKAVLQTPNGKMIEIDEDGDKIQMSDQHNNKIELTAAGIMMESAADIIFKTAKGNIKVEGMNIEMNASATYSAKGNASAELQSGGKTVIKGGIVNIN